MLFLFVLILVLFFILFFLWLTDYSRAYYLLSIIVDFPFCLILLIPIASTIVVIKDIWYDSSVIKVVKTCFVA